MLIMLLGLGGYHIPAVRDNQIIPESRSIRDRNQVSGGERVLRDRHGYWVEEVAGVPFERRACLLSMLTHTL